ncbi:hypothetical protein E2C01_064950 [Portunus trituberculatus]|uniref:Uncharacterized protein n=1 Tax=Portunus trituberculatus TaxID=210409 RepID=A0A5B7HL82_PORTR|nr:hypothetical protein [Portunus trituberculatus]
MLGSPSLQVAADCIGVTRRKLMDNYRTEKWRTDVSLLPVNRRAANLLRHGRREPRTDLNPTHAN